MSKTPYVASFGGFTPAKGSPGRYPGFDSELKIPLRRSCGCTGFQGDCTKNDVDPKVFLTFPTQRSGINSRLPQRWGFQSLGPLDSCLHRWGIELKVAALSNAFHDPQVLIKETEGDVHGFSKSYRFKGTKA